ncbi:MAG: PQQ-binding-like beta-propeller repeat protein, partial [Planctomycetaceae bacterium]|nr:PQQ-binding-like beta-propeller repeat protein [Planctomycetaceae bacterium]
PTIADGHVYALGATGMLRCLRGENGELVWQQDLLKLAATDPATDLKAVAWGRSASPLLVDDQVIIPLGGAPDGTMNSLVALHWKTGETLWRSGDRQVSYGSPTIMTLAEKRQVVSVNEDTVSGHDLQTGELLWEHAWPGQSNGAATVSQPVAVMSDRILLSKGYQQGAMMLKVVPAASKAGSHRYVANPIWTNPGVLKTKFT